MYDFLISDFLVTHYLSFINLFTIDCSLFTTPYSVLKLFLRAVLLRCPRVAEALAEAQLRRRRKHYSVRRLFTGFAIAALIAWKLIVMIVIRIAISAETINTLTPMFIR